MSSAPKKGKQSAPPPAAAAPAPAPQAAPVAVVEEPVAEAEIPVELPKPEYNENQRRVLFATLPIKPIVSFHSGSILAQDDPVSIELTAKQTIELKNAFAAHASILSVAVTALPVSEAEKKVMLAKKLGLTQSLKDASGETLSKTSGSSLPEINAEHPHAAVDGPPTVTENRISVNHLQSIVQKLHGELSRGWDLDASLQRSIIEDRLPVRRDQTPPPPPPPEPEQPVAPVDNKAAKGGAKAQPPAPVPVAEEKKPEHARSLPADGLYRVDSLNEDEFISWYCRFFADAFAYGQRLRLFASRGEVTEVKQLLHRYCAINSADGEHMTALHHTCEFDRVEVLQLLAQIGGTNFALNAHDKSGWTPLHCAVHHNSLACIKVLLKWLPSVDIEAKTKQLQTPMHVAVSQNRGPVLFLLLSHGANFSAVDQNNMNVLHIAAFRGHIALYRELVKEAHTRGVLLALKSQKDRLGRVPEEYLEDSERTPEVSEPSADAIAVSPTAQRSKPGSVGSTSKSSRRQ